MNWRSVLLIFMGPLAIGPIIDNTSKLTILAGTRPSQAVLIQYVTQTSIQAEPHAVTENYARVVRLYLPKNRRYLPILLSLAVQDGFCHG